MPTRRFLKLLPEIKPGMTEKALAARLEYYMSSMGSEKPSFDTIIASGARSALPHGMASDKQIEIGDLLPSTLALCTTVTIPT